MTDPPRFEVAIVGGGLAGLSTAVYLARRGGARITLFEAQPRLGGQAASWRDADGDPVETGIHLAFPWYENFARLYQDVGRPLRLVPTDGNYYLCDGPSGRVRTLYGGRSLLKTAFGLATFPGLTARERLRVVRLFWRMVRTADGDAERHDGQSVVEFLRERGATPNMIRQLALATVTIQGLHAEDASAASFVKFMRTLYGSVGNFEPAFFAAPLHDALVRPLEEYLTRHGVTIRRGTRVTRLEVNNGRVSGLHTERGERHTEYDHIVLALPGYLVPPLLPERERRLAPFADLARLRSATVVTLQLGYDARVLPDGNVRISNRQGVIFDGVADKAAHWGPLVAPGSVLQVLIDAADDISPLGDDEIYGRVLADLGRFFPRCRVHRPRKWQVLRHRDIYCETRPGYWSLVPRRHQTSIANLLLAGDYTDGPYHYGMESAVISGKRVAGLLFRGGVSRVDPVLPVRYLRFLRRQPAGVTAA